MKLDKMPSTVGLVLFSWLILLAGVGASAYLLLTHKSGVLVSAAVLAAASFIAVLVRMLANLGQMVFDILDQAHRQNASLIRVQEAVEKINCDSRDMNESLHMIKVFFEQIAGHLELKK